MVKISKKIFEIASTNRFYSKVYADLYSELINKYEIMRTIVETSLTDFISLFDNINYVDPLVNYDLFCKNNKDNEKRKALSTFFINLMLNNIISEEIIVDITRKLLFQVYEFIFVSSENKKNEVDELTENITLLFKKELYSKIPYELIDNLTILEVISKLANCNKKLYPSLTNKTVFKFIDLCEL